ncbi:MAG: EamA family transporter [Candidatus Schmidhempelia sp.]|nr:EamA family transporter [Candidatus Schmidhempelia sp.]
MNTWLIYALLSAIFAALVAIFGKIGLSGLDANTATAIRSIVMAVFLIGVVLCQGKFDLFSDIVSNKKAMVFILFSGIAGALSWLFYFMAIKYGPVSKVAPIDKLSVVFVVIFSVVVLGEKLSLIGLFGVIAIAVGSLLLALG